MNNFKNYIEQNKKQPSINSPSRIYNMVNDNFSLKNNYDNPQQDIQNYNQLNIRNKSVDLSNNRVTHSINENKNVADYLDY